MASQPGGLPLWALPGLRLGWGLEPVPQAPEKGDRLAHVAVEHFSYGEVDVGDRPSGGSDERTCAGWLDRKRG
jgi:hypothetical protein